MKKKTKINKVGREKVNFDTFFLFQVVSGQVWNIEWVTRVRAVLANARQQTKDVPIRPCRFVHSNTKLDRNNLALSLSLSPFFTVPRTFPSLLVFFFFFQYETAENQLQYSVAFVFQHFETVLLPSLVITDRADGLFASLSLSLSLSRTMLVLELIDVQFRNWSRLEHF